MLPTVLRHYLYAAQHALTVLFVRKPFALVCEPGCIMGAIRYAGPRGPMTVSFVRHPSTVENERPRLTVRLA